MIKISVLLISILVVLVFIPITNATTYLNNFTQFNGPNNVTLSLNGTPSISDNINHTFVGKSSGSAAGWFLEYFRNDTSGYLLKLKIKDEGSGSGLISQVDCSSNTDSEVCGPSTTSCGVDFAQNHTFSTTFNSTSSTAKLMIDGSTLSSLSSLSLCSAISSINRIRFSRSTGNPSFTVDNNSLTANPSAPDTTPPIINGTLNSTSGYNNIKINNLINITYNITDETGLSYANITWNFTNNNIKINFTGLSGTSTQINNVQQIPCGVGCVINITGYATDSSGNTNQNSTLFNVADTLGTINLGFNLSSVFANSVINISGNVTEPDGNISFGWITYNQSGNPSINYTFQGSGNNFNFSKAIAISNTRGNVINFTVYYNDSLGTIVQNSSVFTVLDSAGFIKIGINNTNPKINDVLNISGNATDIDGNLSFGIASLNVSGNPQLNFSFDLSASGINGNFSKAFRINLTKNNWINFTVIYNDTFGAFVQNSTLISINDSAPTQSTPTITSNDDNNRRNGTLTCNNQSTNDLDGDLVTNFIKWFNDSMLINESINSATLNVGNYSKNDNLTCEITPFDGELNGTARNSTSFTILNAAPLLNISIANKSWDKDTSTTINLLNGFFDIDNDNLTYNYSDVSNIAISINNQTGVATLNPSSGFTGTRYVVFYAFDGTNITASNNATLTVNDVTPTSSGGGSTSSGGGGGGSGSAGFVCNLNWNCGGWSDCSNGGQARKCTLVEVPVFTLNQRCPQNIIPDQSRNCTVAATEPIINLINQTEIKNEEPQNKTAQNQNPITGAVVGNSQGLGMNTLWIVFAFVLMALSALFYGKYSHKRLFKKESLSEEEMKKLNEMLSYRIFKK